MKVYLLLFFVALATTLLLTPVVRRVALGLNVLTPLRERDVHAVPIPRLGGLALTGGMLVALLLGHAIPYLRPAYEGSGALWATAVGAVAICLLGAIDDVWELDWLAKLSGQFLVAGAMAFGGVQLISIPLFGVTIGSSRLSILVSTLFLVAIMNAVNFIDGLDGLAAGLIGIGSLSFFAYSYMLTRLTGASSYATSAAVVTIALAGVCLGFLWYNFHPASIFMGDSGAMVLGLVLGAAAIIVTGQVNPLLLTDRSTIATWIPLLLPLAVLVIPLGDLLITPLLRIFHGVSPVSPTRTHLHDRLLMSGHSHMGVVLILYGWTALACVVSVSLIALPAGWVLLGALIPAALMVIATSVQFPNRKRRLRERYARGAGTYGGAVVIDDGVEVISRPRLATPWQPLSGGADERAPQEGGRESAPGAIAVMEAEDSMPLDSKGPSDSNVPPDTYVPSDSNLTVQMVQTSAQGTSVTAKEPVAWRPLGERHRIETGEAE